jgi:hypothetical protein
MGNINAHPPSADFVNPTQSNTENSDLEPPSSRIRYVEIQLEQGKLGEKFQSIVANCVRKISNHEGSLEYVQVVLEFIHSQVQSGRVHELEGGLATKGIASAANWPSMAHLTNEERIALDVSRADALQRLSARARQGF